MNSPSVRHEQTILFMELRESEKGISKHDGEALAEEISFYLFNPCLHSFFPIPPGLGSGGGKKGEIRLRDSGEGGGGGRGGRE
jgi:hypothetical protein